MSIKERIEKLKRVASIKTIELNQAAEQVHLLQIEFMKHKEQYDRLQSYLSEYLSDRDMTLLKDVHPEILALRGGFINQLQDSVTLQAKQLEQTQQRFDAVKLRWFELKKLIEKIEDQIKQCQQERQTVVEKVEETYIQAHYIHQSNTSD